MRALFAAAAALFALVAATAPASAQNYQTLTSVARDMYFACIQAASGQGVANPDNACACASGYLGGALSDRDYEIAGRLARIGALAEAGATQAQLEAEIAAFLADGFTEADANRVNQLVQSHTARGSAVCAGITNQNSI